MRAVAADHLQIVLHRISGTQHPLPETVVILIGIGVTLVGLLPWLWQVAEDLDVIAHEGAHAMVASLFGRKIWSVTLEPDGTGATTHTGVSDLLPWTLIAAAGYFGPTASGLLAAKLISAGHVVAVLWLALLLLALLLTAVDNAFGFISVLGTGTLLFLVAWRTSLGIQAVAAYTLTWTLLIAGLRKVIKRGLGAADAWALAENTHVPRFIWVGLWGSGAIIGMAAGAHLMLFPH
jgi:hypothetical protein